MTLEQKAWFEYGRARGCYKTIRTLFPPSISRLWKDRAEAREIIQAAWDARRKAYAWAAVPYHRRNCGNCVQLARDSHWCFECYGDCPPDNYPMTYANWRPAHPDYMETEYIRRLHTEKKGGAQ